MEGEVVIPMLTQIGNAFTEVLGWLGEFLTSLTSDTGELAPLLIIFTLGVGVTLAHFCARFIKSLMWGA